MRSIRKLTLAAVLALAMVAAFALPAFAGDAHVVVFRGSATVSPGLSFPHADDPFGGDGGTWEFEAPSTNTSPSLCKSLPSTTVDDEPGVVDCALHVKGDLGPVATVEGQSLGAWCGLSTGFNGGNGTYPDDYDDDDGDHHDVENVGWVVSAGSVLPVTGETDSGGKLVGLVQASGSDLAADCNTSGGASSFDVNGVVAFVG